MCKFIHICVIDDMACGLECAIYYAFSVLGMQPFFHIPIAIALCPLFMHECIVYSCFSSPLHIMSVMWCFTHNMKFC